MTELNQNLVINFLALVLVGLELSSGYFLQSHGEVSHVLNYLAMVTFEKINQFFNLMQV